MSDAAALPLGVCQLRVQLLCYNICIELENRAICHFFYILTANITNICLHVTRIARQAPFEEEKVSCAVMQL